MHFSSQETKPVVRTETHTNRNPYYNSATKEKLKWVSKKAKKSTGKRRKFTRVRQWHIHTHIKQSKSNQPNKKRSKLDSHREWNRKNRRKPDKELLDWNWRKKITEMNWLAYRMGWDERESRVKKWRGRRGLFTHRSSESIRRRRRSDAILINREKGNRERERLIDLLLLFCLCWNLTHDVMIMMIHTSNYL